MTPQSPPGAGASPGPETPDLIWFTAEQRSWTDDLWRVYDTHFATVIEDTANLLRKSPRLAPLLSNGAVATLVDPSARNRDRLRRTFAGDWSAYAGYLRLLGAELAVAGLGFEAWCETVGVLERRLVPLLVEAYGNNPARLTTTLQALVRFGNCSTAVVGEQYVQSKQLLVAEGEEARAQAMTALQVSADQLRISEQQNRDIKEQSRQIKEANRLKSEFLANMSHELRTPLNAIIGFTELIHDGVVEPGSQQQQEFLDHILASGRHLLQLINDVLDLAKVESGKLEFHPENVSLPGLVGEVLSVLRTNAATKHIELRAEIDPTLEDLFLDPGRLKQVLYNYLSNALKFTPEGGKVMVRGRLEDTERFRLEVEDSGIGIRAQDIGRLWGEFQQLDSAMSKQHQGTGLGLALTRRLVEAQGGSVGVRSSPGQGSCFHALLPRRAISGQTVAPSPGRTIVAGSPTILVVEDNPVDRDLIVRTLAGAGFGVETAATAAEAVELCQQQRFAAITLDMLLPDASGIEALREIRKQARQADTPVVVVTVSADRKVMAGFSVTDVLPKPLDAGALLRTLERTGVRPDAGGTVLVIDDDRRSLELMAASLRQLGFRSYCTGDGHDALARAATEMPLAVIVDLLMPAMNGFEFLERFRELPDSRHVPVIVWTIKDLSARERTTLRLSSQAVVQKNGSAALVEELRAFLPARPAVQRV